MAIGLPDEFVQGQQLHGRQQRGENRRAREANQIEQGKPRLRRQRLAQAPRQQQRCRARAGDPDDLGVAGQQLQRQRQRQEGGRA